MAPDAATRRSRTNDSGRGSKPSTYLDVDAGADGDAEASNLLQAAFGGNLVRLVAVKRRDEPDNPFHRNSTVAPPSRLRVGYSTSLV